MIGKKIHNFAQTLWGFNRSITGEGVRQTLKVIKELIPELEIRSISSSKQVFWWRDRDSNPGRGLTLAGFQDRCIQPLCHPSEATYDTVT